MNSVLRYLTPTEGEIKKDLMSGITVALALIPEAIAFALVAGVNPTIGLFAAFFMCLITAVIGGRPGMISGATGSMAVVLAALVKQYGIETMLATIILTGIIEVSIGLLHWGKFIRMMPKSVMVGFVNGLAIVIFLAQMKQFTFVNSMGHSEWLSGSALYTMLALVALAMIITHYLPRITTAIPSALTAIVVVSVIVISTHMHTRVVQDMMHGNTLTGAILPQFHVPHFTFNWNKLQVIFSYAFVLAVIGLSESLMTLSLIDERTQTHGKGNRECIAQGIANIVSGFFYSMGGCAMIGQSMINITSGGRGRLSGITAGVFLFIFVVIGWPLIKLIPLAALVGVMMMVVYETFEWATFTYIRNIPLHDAFIIVVVTIVTVLTNLAIAVLIGIVLASLVFAWQTAKNIHADQRLEGTTRTYSLHGPLFFGSSKQFTELFNYEQDPKEIEIDFQHSRVFDHSAIDAIKTVVDRYQSHGKILHLKHLSIECKKLLGNAGNLVDVNLKEDPDYHVATDELD